MCNAANSKILLALCAIVLASCGGDDPDKVAAKDLADRAESALAQGDVTTALALMDSVDKLYPQQVEVRRQVMALRPQAIEKATIAQIQHTDSMICEAQLLIQELEPQFKHIPSAQLEGYYVYADAYNADFANQTGFEARVNDNDFTFYIAANNQAHAIGLNQVALSTEGAECASVAIPAGNARMMQVEGFEIASFLPEESYDLGQWAAEHASNINAGSLRGSKGEIKMKINDRQAQAFAKAWQYADAKQRLRSALILREKLDRQLQVARDHSANHPVDQQSE